MAIQTQNPTTGNIIKTFVPHTDADIDRAIERSHTAFQTMRYWSFSQRAVCMLKVADIVESNAQRLGEIITLEMGKTLKSAIAEAKKCALVCRYYAEHAATYLADEVVPTQATKAYRHYQPLGTVLAIMPWNYPLWQVFRFAAPALMAGNSSLLKHASNVPQCALAIADMFRQAGFPEGAFETLLIRSTQVEAILRDRRVKAATLTGSEAAGASIAAICGQEIKPSVLELGGSDAFIIMPSADLDEAVRIGTLSRTQNNGQSCIAAKRFIVHADIYDEVRVRFKSAFEALKVGDPMAMDTDIGPLVNADSLTEVHTQVEGAITAGAVRITGAQALTGAGFYFTPGILENITPDMALYRDEIFAPVALLFKVDSLDAAIALANDSDFGLSSAIFTQDKNEQARAISDIEAGASYINAMSASDPRLPFGGIKRSGYGRELSAEGIRAFCNIKTVSIA